MDPATPVNVAKGAVATCEFVLSVVLFVAETLTVFSQTAVAAGTLTALRALLQGSRHPTPLALSAAVNGGIAGAVFFSLRDALVSPLLTEALHSRAAAQEGSSSSRPSWTQLRTHHLLDSTLSGAITGGVLNTWQFGRSRSWAGARTGAILCAFLQLGYNELGVMRVKFVSQKIQEPKTPSPAPLPNDPDKPRISIFDRLMSVIGFRKMSDEEYLRALKKQRDEALERITVLEQERREREHPSDDANEKGT